MNRRKIRQWVRKCFKAASSEGTRHWITRLQRTEDQHYHELRRKIDQLQQDIDALRGSPKKI